MDRICRIHSSEKPFTDEEKREFHQMLKDKPDLKKAYENFKLTTCQQLRSRLGQDPFLTDTLDKLFEIAAISEEGEVLKLGGTMREIPIEKELR